MVQEKVEAFFGREPNKGVNPDEVVALGTIQGGVLGGDVSGVQLLDVTPLSLGRDHGRDDGARRAQHDDPDLQDPGLSTAADNQPRWHQGLPGRAQVHQGQPPARELRPRGHPRGSRGVPQIEVEFKVDANGILEVRATDKGTGKEQYIKIESSSGLSDEEVEKMKRDAEAHAAEDEKQREVVDLRNELEQLAHGTKPSSRTTRTSLRGRRQDREPQSRKTRGTARLRGQGDPRVGEDTFAKKAQKLGEILYAEAQAEQQGAPGADAGAAGSDDSDEPIDADFEVKS